MCVSSFPPTLVVHLQAARVHSQGAPPQAGLLHITNHIYLVSRQRHSRQQPWVSSPLMANDHCSGAPSSERAIFPRAGRGPRAARSAAARGSPCPRYGRRRVAARTHHRGELSWGRARHDPKQQHRAWLRPNRSAQRSVWTRWGSRRRTPTTLDRPPDFDPACCVWDTQGMHQARGAHSRPRGVGRGGVGRHASIGFVLCQL